MEDFSLFAFSHPSHLEAHSCRILCGVCGVEEGEVDAA